MGHDNDRLAQARNVELTRQCLSAVLNAMQDHYSQQDARTRMSHDAYWRHRLKLSGFQRLDDYVQVKVNALVEAGFDSVDSIARHILSRL